MTNGINIPKVVLLIMGIGVTSYVIWYAFAALRKELSNELQVHQFYK